jgi:hypothetical protein
MLPERSHALTIIELRTFTSFYVANRFFVLLFHILYCLKWMKSSISVDDRTSLCLDVWRTTSTDRPFALGMRPGGHPQKKSLVRLGRIPACPRGATSPTSSRRHPTAPNWQRDQPRGDPCLDADPAPGGNCCSRQSSRHKWTTSRRVQRRLARFRPCGVRAWG